MTFKKYPKIYQIGHAENKEIFENPEDEIILQEKLDGCFDYNTKILLSDFTSLPIGKIVNKKMNVEVLSYNTKTKKIEPKKVINWYNNGKTNKWKTVVLKGKNTSRKKRLIVTDNHKIYTNKGLIEVKDLKCGDRVFTPKYILNEIQKQLILGSLLGDACLIPTRKNRYYSETHSLNQKDYIYFKKNILGNALFIKDRKIKLQSGTEGINIISKCDDRLNEIVNLCYPNGHKEVTLNWLNELNIFGIAIWFLDDGSVNYNYKQRPRINLHTEGYSRCEVELIKQFFKMRGYNCKELFVKNKYWIINFDADSSEKMLFDIAPFVPTCMDNKLPKYLRNNKYIENINILNNELLETEVLEIKKGKLDCYKNNNNKYDIEVEHNHNYFANNILVSNSNFRFMFKDGKIIFGSRTQELHPDKEHKYQKNFKRCIEYIKEKIDNHPDRDVLIDCERLIFYGENMVKHTMNYDWDKIPPFLGFDIYHIREERFLGYKEVKEFYDFLSLDMVPLIKICKAKDIDKISEEIIPKSKYSDEKAEGLMFKNYNKQIFAKLVREKFREENRKVFGGSKKHAKTDEEYFVLKYCTNARIDKIIFKKLDEGKELEMSLMGDLVNEVYADIWEENWREIIFSKKVLDLNKFKKLVSARCLNVLKQMITNNCLK